MLQPDSIILNKFARFEAWLKTDNANFFVDNAIEGYLTDHEVIEVLEDFDIPWSSTTRKIAAGYIAAAIAEG